MDILKNFLLQLTSIATLIFTYQIFFAEKLEKKHNENIILSFLFGLSILLCMSFPVVIGSDYRIDIRIVPLLLGTLYGGWMTGIVLSILIILYRMCWGFGLGVYTNLLTLVFSMPIVVLMQKKFIYSKKRRKLQIAFLLVIYNSLVGMITVSSIGGPSFIEVLHTQFIHITIDMAVVPFFISFYEKIKDMIRKKQQLQSEVKDAEIAFLRSQINPHFLYNALNSIAALCIEEPHKAEELTLDLSHYLRGRINFKRMNALTTLENELDLVEAYVNIEKARFGPRLCVEYDVDANLDILIPPLILQPLVENSIKHGLMSHLQGGTVKISVKQEKDAVVSFAIEDNGCGMSEQKRNETLQLNETKGIGLWNISQRLQLLYGISICVESVEGIGTKVFFDIPIRAFKQSGG